MSENPLSSDLIRGHIDTIILKALFESDRYGYDIIKEVEQKAQGRFKLKQPTLYSCLKRLEEQGFTSSYWGEKSFGGRKKYYSLTEMGREVFLKNQNNWKVSRDIIDSLITATNDGAVLTETEEVQQEDLGAEGYDALEEYDSSDCYELPAEKSQTAETTAPAVEPVIETITESADVDDVQANDGAAVLSARTDEPEETSGQAAKEDEDFPFPSFFSGSELPRPLASLFKTIESTPAATSPSADDAANPLEQTVLQPAGQAAETDKAATYELPPEPKEYSSNDTTYELDPVTGEAKQIIVHKTHDAYSADYAADGDSKLSILSRIDDIYKNVTGTQSYVDNVAGQSYVPPKPSKPLPASSKEYTQKLDEEELPFKPQQPIPQQQQPQTKPQPQAQQHQQSQTPAQEKSVTQGFMRYDAALSPKNRESEIVSTQYQALLTKLVKKDDAPEAQTAPSAAPHQQSNSASVLARLQQEQKLRQLADEAREMGDEIVIRSHDNSVKLYNSENFFYSNKLMLVQYGIMFVIMLLEIAVLFFVNEMVLRAGLAFVKRDVWLYIISVGVALLLPLAAFYACTRDYNRRKSREQVSVKSSLIFRIIAMVQIWVIIGGINVYFDILTGVFVDYLAMFVLPVALSLNLLLSMAVYFILLKSNRFNVKS